MATIKHTSSKNFNYAAAEEYLIFQHDEITGRVLKDAAGRPLLRDEYLFDTLECGGEDFAIACLRANRKYNQNSQRKDVKTHQYILSFDPRDAADHGLIIKQNKYTAKIPFIGQSKTSIEMFYDSSNYMSYMPNFDNYKI